MKKIEKIIKEVDEDNQEKIDWTKVWGKKYPILNRYQDEIESDKYINTINELLDDIKNEYGYSTQDSMLVLKDILYHIYLNKKNKEK